MISAAQQQKDLVKQALAGSSSAVQGVCNSIDWAARTAQVNVAGSTIDLPMLGVPIVGAYCWVGTMGSTVLVLGPVPPAPLATATSSPSSGLVAVTGDDGMAYTVASNGFTITSGTRVVLQWADRGGFVVALESADPLTKTPVSGGGNTGGGSTASTAIFRPVYSGSQNTGASNFWTSDVLCSDSNEGMYSYATQIADTIPDTATITRVSLQLAVTGTGYGDAPNWGLHNLASLSGVLSVSSATPLPGGSGNFLLPNSFGDALKTGSMKGVGTAHGGYWQYGNATQSGMLTISWQ